MMFFLLFTAWNGHPFINFHRCIADCNPFFLPKQIEQVKKKNTFELASFLCNCRQNNGEKKNNNKQQTQLHSPMPDFINGLHNSLNIIFGSASCFSTHGSRHFEFLILNFVFWFHFANIVQISRFLAKFQNQSHFKKYAALLLIGHFSLFLHQKSNHFNGG